MKISPVQLRGAIAREFLLREYLEPSSSFVQAKPIDLGDTVSADDAELKDNFVSLYKTAECVARKAPKDVDALVRSSHKDEPEAQAYRQLLPVWSSCQPNSLFANPTIYGLKGVESEILYRLLKASDPHPTDANMGQNHA